ncbi:hypothetical protein H4Q32_014177 [Labeo rohita]|uniref:Chromo domain-containing protein n=1 Tax=Labeo rohita TaxID=84645 RepID=A0ABQ8LT49_LABRO|nr:hypothetical protein H4Q32_014177 [Labeo rohita]
MIRQTTPFSFRLAFPNHYHISPIFHVSLLRPAAGPSEEGEEVSGDQGPQPIMVDGEKVYQVRDLIDSRRRGRILQYLVNWEGYGPEERSLVNADNILDANLVEEFHRTNTDRPAPRLRGRTRHRLPPRARSRSQGRGSVTETNSVIPPSDHQRALSPEY